MEPARTEDGGQVCGDMATKAKIRGARDCRCVARRGVSVEAANISSRSGIMMGTSADLAGLASMCVPAVMAMPDVHQHRALA